MDTITSTTVDLTLSRFDENTPIVYDMDGFYDADEEMLPIAEHIKTTTMHNDDIEPKRIKFLYQNDRPKKGGGRFAMFELIRRSDMEKMINNDYDFILIVFYDAWRELDGEQKVIQLDKALCAIDMGTIEKPKMTKKAPDSNEFLSNMRQYGANKVMDVSEMVHLVCERIIEERKEDKKAQ